MLEKHISKNLKFRKFYFRKSFFLSFIQILTSFSNLIFLNLLSTRYSFEVLGLLSFISSFANFPGMIIGDGFNQQIIIHITNQNKNLSQIASISLISRLLVVIPVIFISCFFLNLEVNNSFACLLMSTEILKNVLPTLLIDEMKLTHILTFSFFFEKLVILILFKYVWFDTSFNLVLVAYSLIQLTSTISVAIIFLRYVPDLKFVFNLKDIKSEIINSFKSIPNILSQLSFIHLMKLSLGFAGDFEFLGKLSVGYKLVNVVLLPLSYYFKIITSSLNQLASKIKKQVFYNKNFNNKNVIKEASIITTVFCFLNLIFVWIFFNIEGLKYLYPNILKFEGILPIAFILIIYGSFGRLSDAIEVVYLGVKGRKAVIKSYLPGTLFSLFFNIVGIVTRIKTFMILGFFLGEFLVFIILLKKLNNLKIS